MAVNTRRSLYPAGTPDSLPSPVWTPRKPVVALTVANGVFALGLIFLLGSEASKRYTYKTSLRSIGD
ncbi:hypothetical protein AB0A73_17150 [Glycomyces sp. NPDC047369]